MNYTSALLLLVACFRTSEPGSLDVSYGSRNKSDNSSAESVEEKMRELRIETVKFQILSKLNPKKLPGAAAAPSEFSREAIRLLLQESENQQPSRHRPFNNGERLIIRAEDKEMACLGRNVSLCRMFRFELNLALNLSSMDLWIYRLTKFPEQISVSSTFSCASEEKSADSFNQELESYGWNKVQLSRILMPSSWNDSVFCSVEIKGSDIQHRGDHRPFLMVSKSQVSASRQRRDASCDTNESCCLKPLRVSFSEIGFNWVLYPVELEANMCSGRCRLDHSSLRTHYERAMSKVLEDDNELQETLGDCWTLCCKPKQLEEVRVIYNDTDGIIHDQYIPELSVKSCSCS